MYSIYLCGEYSVHLKPCNFAGTYVIILLHVFKNAIVNSLSFNISLKQLGVCKSLFRNYCIRI